MRGRVYFGRPEVTAIYVQPAQLTAAVELVDGHGVRPGREATVLAQLLRLIGQHVVDGGRLPVDMELRYAELVTLLASPASPPPSGGG